MYCKINKKVINRKRREDNRRRDVQKVREREWKQTKGKTNRREDK